MKMRGSAGLVLVVIVTAGLARAEDRPAPPTEDAGALLRRAIDEIGQARFRPALDLLGRAERLAADSETQGRVQLYLGITSAVLGDAWRAREHFRAALMLNPEVNLDPRRIKSEVVQLLEDERRGLQGTLVVRLSDDGSSTVLVDGKPAPRRVTLAVGPHRLEVKGSGGRRLHDERVVISSGETTTVRVVVPGPPERPRRPRRQRRLWTWVALGAAGAAATAAAVVYGAGVADENELWEKETGPERGADLKDALRAKQNAIYGLLGVSGTLFVTAAVLYYFEGRPERGPRLGLMLGPTSGVVLTWRH